MNVTNRCSEPFSQSEGDPAGVKEHQSASPEEGSGMV